jgi:hypothetical protein
VTLLTRISSFLQHSVGAVAAAAAATAAAASAPTSPPGAPLREHHFLEGLARFHPDGGGGASDDINRRRGSGHSLPGRLALKRTNLMKRRESQALLEGVRKNRDGIYQIVSGFPFGFC